MKKSFLLTSALAFTLFSAGQATAADVAPEAMVYESESNDTLGTSDRFVLGDTVNGRLYPGVGYTTDVDVFSFSSFLGGTVTLSLTNVPAGCDYDLYLMDGGGNVLATSANRLNANETISKQLVQGIFYVKVVSYKGYSAYSYNLKGTVQ